MDIGSKKTPNQNLRLCFIMNVMKVIKKQSNGHDCLVCGIDNPSGLHASFYEMEDESLIALFKYDSRFQSFPERTHGGMIAAVLDETIGRAIWIKEPELWACTLKLEVEYHQAVPYDVPLKCVGRIDKENSLTFHGMAEIMSMDGKLLARGTALYMKLRFDQISPKTSKGMVIHPNDINVDIPDDVKEIY
jgi:Thioesterase superfamily.